MFLHVLTVIDLVVLVSCRSIVVAVHVGVVDIDADILPVGVVGVIYSNAYTILT